MVSLSTLSSNLAFSHAFQPIIDIQSNEITSYEVLLRGPNQEPPTVVFNQIHQDAFIAFDQISREKAISLASDLGLTCCLSLNFTPAGILFNNGEYLIQTINFAKRSGIDPKQLIIEITEGEAIKDIHAFAEVLNKLRRVGATISIDDFGAGHSGLSLLADIQPDQVKIDMNLIRNIDTNGPRQAIVKGIKNICFDLGIDTLAEGVETLEEFDFLKTQGISLFQGHLFSPPVFESLPKKLSAFLHQAEPVAVSL
ncbi:EAL domain-containing protein [Leucothrix sargassi]|nr:EAL domain-containing protein [Leucothrix sargassi]